jgi:hypothetical protein
MTSQDCAAMRRQILLWIGLLSIASGGCSLTRQDGAPQPTPTLTIIPFPQATPPPVTPAPEPTLDTWLPLITDTGPFENAAALLDGVCFEYMRALDGQTWVWTTATDLAAFYDRADASELCPSPAERGVFDFGDRILAGAVTASVGCDAAHRVIDMTRDDTTRTQTLRVAFDVRAGCPYELAQPFLVALPRPAAGDTIRVEIQLP